MRDAVIVEAVRTPIGKRNGALSSVHPADLSAMVLTALMDRTGVDPSVVDDVMWGCVSQVGEQTFNIARTALLSAGWPESVPATTVDRQCGSSQQALHFAAAGLISGYCDVVVAGGVESMSRVPMGSPMSNGQSPLGNGYSDRYGSEFPNQGVSAEMIADRWRLSRAQLDEFSLESHAGALTAMEKGYFEEQSLSVKLETGDIVSLDEGPRAGSTLERLGSLGTPFRSDGRVTAGNSSQISDGAAALLLTTSERASQLGLTPIARIHTSVVVGSEPNIMLTGPIPATKKVLERANLTLADIGVFEANEAFASVVLAWMSSIGVDRAKVNPNGGAIALGHPLGGSGARLATTLVHHMKQRGIRYGLQTMCEGGGQANATIFELLI
jgi:acetyl-CoA acyltransferase